MARYHVRRWLGYPSSTVVGLALTALAVQLACAGLEGLGAVEQAHLAAGRRFALGYAGAAPVPAWVLGAIAGAGGASPFWVRLLPAVAGAALVFVVAATVRRLEGSRFAQALAALAAVVAPAFLAAHHRFGPGAFAPCWWGVAALILLDICGMRRRGGWIALGVWCGLGIWITPTVVWLLAGSLATLAATRERRWFRTPWPWGGLGLALGIAGAQVWWQAGHGWPAWTAAPALGPTPWPLHAALWQWSAMHVLLLPVWLGGLGFLAFGVPTTPYRALVWPVLAAAAAVLALRQPPETLAAACPPLLAAGALWIDRVISRRGRPWMRPAVLTAAAAAGLATAPLALPLLPRDARAATRRAYARWLPLPDPAGTLAGPTDDR